MTTGADAALQPRVAAEFQKLASALADIPEPKWSAPSLCDGWSVRNVVAHLTMAERYSPEQFQAELEVDG
ncbi:MAG: maleylpyruvate isomerase N-terminal domain-containing protein, partial [Mycobacteriaceae bacterium]